MQEKIQAARIQIYKVSIKEEKVWDRE